jgi:hypothetical protein
VRWGVVSDREDPEGNWRTKKVHFVGEAIASRNRNSGKCELTSWEVAMKVIGTRIELAGRHLPQRVPRTLGAYTFHYLHLLYLNDCQETRNKRRMRWRRE